MVKCGEMPLEGGGGGGDMMIASAKSWSVREHLQLS